MATSAKPQSLQFNNVALYGGFIFMEKPPTLVLLLFHARFNQQDGKFIN